MCASSAATAPIYVANFVENIIVILFFGKWTGAIVS